jgi:hypothetical protein
MMAWKPWYERAAELDSREDVEEFMKGVYVSQPKRNSAVFTGLIAGYVGGKVAAKASKKK